MLAVIERNRNSHLPLVGTQNEKKKPPTLEDNLTVACTTKLSLTQYGNC